MRLLLDINVLLDVVFERPGAAASSAVIRSCSREHEAWISWHSLAVLFYVIRRQLSQEAARSFVSELLEWARVSRTGHDDAVAAISWAMNDFEDALQAAAAIACDAAFIITRNENDFARSPVPALAPEAFLARVP